MTRALLKRAATRPDDGARVAAAWEFGILCNRLHRGSAVGASQPAGATG
jgi:hypothetical protein